MKLLRLQINNSFRSLPAGFNIVFRNDADDSESNLNEPICLVGVNGSGKSNVLEALAEIFSYIDQTFLNFVVNHSDSPAINSFELEYLLPFTFDIGFITMDSGMTWDTKYVRIKIVKDNDVKPQFFYTNEHEVETPIVTKMASALPNRVIGYSSGQNELLSIPFYRIKFRYYNALLQEQKKSYRESVDYSRLKYIDYDENANILLSNYLMAKDTEIDVIKDRLFIDNISSFEITVNRNQKKRGILQIDKEIDKLLLFLKAKATVTTEISSNIEQYNFEVSPELKKEFQDNFLDASGLYTLFKRLGYLNLNYITKKKMTSLLTMTTDIYDTYQIVDYAPEKKLFQISGIQIKKSNLPHSISYRNLSDGEHQFIHIIGTLMMMKEESALFLFDEPETHFNPRWKYEYTETFKKVTSSLKSQIVLTTHDPVLISGLAKENVIVFNKPEEGQERTYKPDKDLKGMGVDAILTSEIFGLNSTLDSETLNEIIDRRKLLVEKERRELTAEENQKLTELSEKLMDIDFNKPFADPLYKDFVMAIENLDVYKNKELTEIEIAEREQIAKDIMTRLNENGF